jgi:hypothetical protein
VNLLGVSDNFMAALEKHNLVGAAVHTLRPDGPLDQTIITTQCLNCKRSSTFPIRWFALEERCSCSGEFDPTPLYRWNAIALTRGCTAATHEVPVVRLKGERNFHVVKN